MSGRRVLLTEYGEDPVEAVERFLVVEDQVRPDVDGLGAHDVLVAVRSASVGWVDLIMASGQYQHMASLPYTPGLEYSGEVEAVGAEVTRFAPGDRVISDGFVTGPRTRGAYQQQGGFATWAVAPEHGLRPLPARLDFDQGCNLLGSYETAWHCLIGRGRLAAGETVLIHGASGATGLAAVHVARRVGARVIATGRSLDKLAIVQQQGADEVVCTAGEDGLERMRDEVRALTDGKGVDVVYDGVGGEISAASLRCVRFGARFLIVGWAATPSVADGKGRRGAPRANVLPTNLIMMKGLDVLGCPTVIATQHDPSIRVERLRQLLGWVEEGSLVPLVTGVYGIEQVREAMMARWASTHVGGVVLRPGGG